MSDGREPGNLPDDKPEEGRRLKTRNDLIELLKSGNISRMPICAQDQPAKKTSDSGQPPKNHLLIQNEDGSQIQLDASGRIAATKDANGEERRFSWNKDGLLVEVSLPYGRWTSSDGILWTNSHGESRRGFRRVDKDGTYWEEDERRRKISRLDGTEVEYHKQGGNLSVLFKNGAVLQEKHGDGILRQIRNPDGSQVHYKLTEGGAMQPLFHRYSQPTRVEFATGDGVKVASDVSEVTFNWQDQGFVEITYRTTSGTIYVLVRGQQGQFISLSEYDQPA